jgi:hypothetical protein
MPVTTVAVAGDIASTVDAVDTVMPVSIDIVVVPVTLVTARLVADTLVTFVPVVTLTDATTDAVEIDTPVITVVVYLAIVLV